MMDFQYYSPLNAASLVGATASIQQRIHKVLQLSLKRHTNTGSRTPNTTVQCCSKNIDIIKP